MKKIFLASAFVILVLAAFKLAFADSNPFGVTGPTSVPAVGYAFGGGKILSSERYGVGGVGTGNNFRGVIIDATDLAVGGVNGKLNYTNASNSTKLNTPANHRSAYPTGTASISGYDVVYGPWRLPTKTELALFKANKAIINTAPGSTNWYWSSTPGSANHVWTQNFANGNTYDYLTYYTCFVRTVRDFTATKH